MVAKHKTSAKSARSAAKSNGRPRRAPRKRIAALPGGDRLVVAAIRKSLGMNRQAFSRLSQFSERAIAKWEAGEPLSAPSRQKMAELQRLQQALSSVINEDSVGQWLQTPNGGFNGLKPLEVIERGEIDRLWRMIYLLESGVPS